MADEEDDQVGDSTPDVVPCLQTIRSQRDDAELRNRKEKQNLYPESDSSIMSDISTTEGNEHNMTNPENLTACGLTLDDTDTFDSVSCDDSIFDTDSTKATFNGKGDGADETSRDSSVNDSTRDKNYESNMEKTEKGKKRHQLGLGHSHSLGKAKVIAWTD